MFINGNWMEAEGAKSFQSFNPASGEPIGMVPDGSDSDAKIAVAAAQEAFLTWSRTTAISVPSFFSGLMQL